MSEITGGSRGPRDGGLFGTKEEEASASNDPMATLDLKLPCLPVFIDYDQDA